MKTVLFAAAALSLIASTAGAEDWKIAGASSRLVKLVDFSSIREQSPNVRLAWTATIYASAEDGVDYILLREEMNCAEETWSILASVDYAVGGSVVGNNYARGSVDHIVPGTIGQGVMEAVCEGKLSFGETSWSTISDAVYDYRAFVSQSE